MTIRELYEQKLEERKKELEEKELERQREALRVKGLWQGARVTIGDALEGIQHNTSDEGIFCVYTDPPVSVNIDVKYKKVKFSDECPPERTLVCEISISGNNKRVICGIDQFQDTFVDFLIQNNIKVN
jgi:hypothetical protein